MSTPMAPEGTWVSSKNHRVRGASTVSSRTSLPLWRGGAAGVHQHTDEQLCHML